MRPFHAQRDVRLAPNQADLARFADELDPQAGVLSLQRQQQGREKARDDRRRPIDADDTGRRAIDAMRETGDLGNALVDLLRPITNALALGRQAVRARQPLDEADAQLLLEREKLSELLSMLDAFTLGFPTVEPRPAR